MAEEKLTCGEKIKEIRRLSGLSQLELAQKIKVGKTTISNYENGYSTPTLNILEKIADALDASIEYFLSTEELENLNDNHIYFARVTKIPVFEKMLDYKIIASNSNRHISQYLEIPAYRNVRTGDFIAIKCPDNTMDNLNIKKGDYIVIETNENNNAFNDFDNGKIYAFDYQNKLYIRKLFKNQNIFTAVADSFSLPQKPFNVFENEIKIIGQCVKAIIDL